MAATSFELHRAEPFADWPKDEVGTADERALLVRFLDYQRAVLARKAAGLTDAQARTPACPPSDVTMLGLVRHLAGVERGWQTSLGGRDLGDVHADGRSDFDPSQGATMADALATYWREVEAADATYAAADLDDTAVTQWATYSVRWILVHLIEEYARHSGHADLLRQALDGATGD